MRKNVKKKPTVNLKISRKKKFCFCERFHFRKFNVSKHEKQNQKPVILGNFSANHDVPTKQTLELICIQIKIIDFGALVQSNSSTHITETSRNDRLKQMF